MNTMRSSATALLDRLPPARRRRLLAASSDAVFAKGRMIFRQGEAAEAVWLLREGWAHLVCPRPSGSPHGGIVVFTVTPADALCGLSALDARTYQTGAVAATACRMTRVPAREFTSILDQSPEFAADVLRLCLRRIRHVTRQYGAMAEPVSCRLVRTLLRLREQFGDSIPMTHRELAQMAWTTTETAIRVIRRLKGHGCLTGARGRILVRDAPALSRYLAETCANASV